MFRSASHEYRLSTNKRFCLHVGFSCLLRGQKWYALDSYTSQETWFVIVRQGGYE